MSSSSETKPPRNDALATSMAVPAGVILDRLHTVYVDSRALAKVAGSVMRDESSRSYFNAVEVHPWKSLRLSDADSQADLVISALWKMIAPSWFMDLNQIADPKEVLPAASIKLRGLVASVARGKVSYIRLSTDNFDVRVRLSLTEGRLADLEDLQARMVWVLGFLWKQQPLCVTAASISIYA